MKGRCKWYCRSPTHYTGNKHTPTGHTKILRKKPKCHSEKGFHIAEYAGKSFFEQSQRLLTIFNPENTNPLFAANPQPVTNYQTFREWFQEGWRHTPEEHTENSECPHVISRKINLIPKDGATADYGLQGF